MTLNKNLLSKYIGNTKLTGIDKDTIYEIIISENKHGYDLNVLYDTDRKHEVNKMIVYASEKSISHNWEI